MKGQTQAIVHSGSPARHWWLVLGVVGWMLGIGLSTDGLGNRALAQESGARQTTQADRSSVTVEKVTTIRETTTTQTLQQRQDGPAPVVAIFVKNRAGKEYDEKIMGLEDLLSSRLAEEGFRVMSREDVINSVSAFGGQGANKGDANMAGADMDEMLSNNTSALRLAQNMGADYLLTASIVSINHNRKVFKGYGLDRMTLESVLRGSYKVLDNSKAGSVTGGTVESSVKVPFQNQVDESTWTHQKHTYAEVTDAVDKLVDEACTKLAAHLTERKRLVAQAAEKGELVSWTVICGTTDMVVPTINRVSDNEFVVGEQKLPVNPMNVVVELNGVVVGTAPGTFNMSPGMHKLRLSREGYRDIERTVSATDGQTLRIDMQMKPEEYARWKDMTAFLEDLKKDAKLNDAQAEAIRGYAQMLRQSGYKVDVKVDTKEAVKVQNQAKEMNVWQ